MAPNTKPNALRCSYQFESVKLKAAMVRRAKEHGRSLNSEINQACKAWVAREASK